MNGFRVGWGNLFCFCACDVGFDISLSEARTASEAAARAATLEGIIPLLIALEILMGLRRR